MKVDHEPTSISGPYLISTKFKSSEGESRMPAEQRGSAAVAWLTSPHYAYEDRFRMLVEDIPQVAQAKRGESYGVFDGIGSAP